MGESLKVLGRNLGGDAWDSYAHSSRVSHLHWVTQKTLSSANRSRTQFRGPSVCPVACGPKKVTPAPESKESGTMQAAHLVSGIVTFLVNCLVIL